MNLWIIPEYNDTSICKLKKPKGTLRIDDPLAKAIWFIPCLPTGTPLASATTSEASDTDVEDAVTDSASPLSDLEDIRSDDGNVSEGAFDLPNPPNHR